MSFEQSSECCLSFLSSGLLPSFGSYLELEELQQSFNDLCLQFILTLPPDLFSDVVIIFNHNSSFHYLIKKSTGAALEDLHSVICIQLTRRYIKYKTNATWESFTILNSKCFTHILLFYCQQLATITQSLIMKENGS